MIQTTEQTWDEQQTIGEYHSLCPTSFSHSEADAYIESPQDFLEVYLTREQPRPSGKQFDVGHVAHTYIPMPDAELKTDGIENTTASWKKWKAPDRKPDMTDDEGEFWFVSADPDDVRSVGPALIRRSDAWGRVGSNVWDIEQYPKGWLKNPTELTGMCRLDLFMPRDIPGFEPVPQQVLSDGGSRTGNAWYDFKKRNAGKILLKPWEGQNGMDGYACVPRMRRAAKRHRGGIHSDRPPIDRIGAAELLWPEGKTYPEYTIFHRDAETGLVLRCRPDLICWPMPGVPWIVDLKTAQSADPDKWTWNAVKYGYHRQVAWYTDLVRAFFKIDPGQPVPFVFVVIEKTRSCRCECFELEEELVEIGRAENRQAIRRLANSMESNTWSSSTSGTIRRIHTPPKMMKESHEYGTGS